MIYGLWQSAAGLQAQEYRQAIIANNLANAETPGFKADRIAFQERLNAAATKGTPRTRHPVLDSMTGGLFETEVYTDFDSKDAPLVPTGGSLDVAIQGDGFLTVRTSDGLRYTRDGRMVMDSDGTLRHVASGGAMLDEQGLPIILDPASGGKIKIDEFGNVRQGGNLVGRVAVVDFADRQQLEKIGHDLYASDNARPVEANGRIRQFYHEGSSVDPVQTLVEMIAATRAYETNARMITLQDETLGRLVNEVGRIG
ncbi:MAG: flagellar hook-basal body protein [Phycisphaerae bacterium]|nr:flagellar hook-basal body protein [Phycisphaerae bacterium]